MVNITDYIKFLKSRESYHARKAREIAKTDPKSSKKQEHTSSMNGEIRAWFESYEASSPAPVDDLFSLNPLDMQNIPDDLSEELSVSKSDTEDAQILDLLRIANRSLDLNEILIGCYRKYDIKHKRNLLTARIYRLIKRDLVHNVGKGTYALGSAPKENGEKEVSLA